MGTRLSSSSALGATWLAGIVLATSAAAQDPDAARRHVPNDPLFSRQWPLDNQGQGGGGDDADVDAPEAWAITRGSPTIVIAVLDDAVQLDHPDLAPNIAAAGRDFRADAPRTTAAPREVTDRHGTSVAGVVAARGDDGIGVTGVCPQCRLLPIGVDGVDDAVSVATADAVRYAVSQGADVINLSWGYARAHPPRADAALRAALEAAVTEGRDGRGTLIVVGATNDAVDNCAGSTLDLAALDSVLAVGVADFRDRIGGAGFGPCIDLVAPSTPERKSTLGVLTTDRTGIDGHAGGDYHETFGGTSAAAPLVAGIAGLLLSLNPDLTRPELQQLLEQTADKIDATNAGYDARGFSVRAGFGRVNAARALVPNVAIVVTPSTVHVGEPFSVTVTASAPFGLDSISWLAEGVPAASHERKLAGQVFASATFDGVTLDRAGTFVLAADALDRRFGNPLPGYPHAASQAGHGATAVLTVIERSEHDSR
ncbi:MAG TPA: S8 family serine peptidase [Gammaproteobacteria bacterium]